MGIGILMDLVLIAIVILNVILGYKKGLINVIFSIFAFLIAIVFTLILYKPVANMVITYTNIDNQIRQMIINNNTNEQEIDNNTNEPISNAIQNTKNEITEQGTTLLANTVSNKVVEILTAIALFIVIRIIVVILKVLIEGIATLPIIKQFDKTGGIIYGLLKSIIIIYFIITILFIVTTINNNGSIASAIDSSYLTKFLYQNNVVVNLLMANTII